MGLRERNKERTRQRIQSVALELFAKRGFDTVSVNEIAEAAEVAKATLFAYFPSKESLVLQGVGGDDLAAIVSARPPGRSPLDALWLHFSVLADGFDVDREELTTRVQVIFASPTLTTAASALLAHQREALAQALAADYGLTRAALMAAQITASLQVVQEEFLRRLAGGTALPKSRRALHDDLRLAFDLLAHGIEKERS